MCCVHLKNRLFEFRIYWKKGNIFSFIQNNNNRMLLIKKWDKESSLHKYIFLILKRHSAICLYTHIEEKFCTTLNTFPYWSSKCYNDPYWSGKYYNDENIFRCFNCDISYNIQKCFNYAHIFFVLSRKVLYTFFVCHGNACISHHSLTDPICWTFALAWIWYYVLL